MFPDAGTDAHTVVETPGRRGEHQPATATPGFYQPEYRGLARVRRRRGHAWQVGAHTEGDRRADAARPRPADHDRSGQPGAAARSGRTPAVPHRGRPELRRRCAGDRRPRRRVAHRRRADGDVPVAHVHAARHDDRRHQRRRRAPRSRTPTASGSPRSACATTRPARRTCAPTRSCACRPTSSTRSAPRPPTARCVYQMSRLRTVVVPPRTSQDEVAPGASLPRARCPRPSAPAAPPASPPTRPTTVLDAALGIPDADAGGITVTSSQHLPGDIAVARIVGVRRRSRDRMEHRLRRARRAVGRRDHPAAGDLRPPRPAGRRRRQALGAHAAPHRRGRRVADRRPPGGHRRQRSATRRSSVPVQFAPLTGSDVRITVTGVRAGRHPRLPRAGAVDDAGRPRRGGTARRAARRRCRPRSRPTAGPICSRSTVSRCGVELRGSTADAAAGKPVDLRGVPGVVGGRRAGARAGRPHGALGAGHTQRHRRRRAGARLRRRGRGDDARRTRRAAAVGHPDRRLRPRRRPGCGSRARAAPRSSWRSAAPAGARRSGWCWARATNAGWEASVAGKDVGGSTLVNGYANGWLVHPTAGTFSVTLRWTPQRTVWIALGVSALAFLVCLFLALRRRRRERTDRMTTSPTTTASCASRTRWWRPATEPRPARRGRGRDRRRRGGRRARELVGGAARRGAGRGGRARATAAIPHRRWARRSHWLRARRT